MQCSIYPRPAWSQSLMLSYSCKVAFCLCAKHVIPYTMETHNVVANFQLCPLHFHERELQASVFSVPLQSPYKWEPQSRRMSGIKNLCQTKYFIVNCTGLTITQVNKNSKKFRSSKICWIMLPWYFWFSVHPSIHPSFQFIHPYCFAFVLYVAHLCQSPLVDRSQTQQLNETTVLNWLRHEHT